MMNSFLRVLLTQGSRMWLRVYTPCLQMLLGFETACRAHMLFPPRTSRLFFAMGLDCEVV